MTLAAAGTIAIAGVALSGGTAGARTEPLHRQPAITTFELVTMPADAEQYSAAQTYEQAIVEIGDGNLDEPAWFDGDSCPPCGMG